MSASLVLASASPRRTALLNQLGIEHQIYPVDIDESAKPEETPEAQVARLAYESEYCISPTGIFSNVNPVDGSACLRYFACLRR